MLFVGVRTKGWYCGVGPLILVNNFYVSCVFALYFFNRFGSWAFVEGSGRQTGRYRHSIFTSLSLSFSWLLSWKLRFLSRAVVLAGIILIHVIK